MQEVTFGRYRLKAYQQTVQNFIQRLREFCQGRGINFFTASSNTDLQELLLKQLRTGGGVGMKGSPKGPNGRRPKEVRIVRSPK